MNSVELRGRVGHDITNLASRIGIHIESRCLKYFFKIFPVLFKVFFMAEKKSLLSITYFVVFFLLQAEISTVENQLSFIMYGVACINLSMVCNIV